MKCNDEIHSNTGITGYLKTGGKICNFPSEYLNTMQHVFFRRRNAKYLILPRKCEIMISNNQNQNNSLTNLGQITLRGKSPKH